MECPVCYKTHTEYKLTCGHSFCYQCITHWYQEYENNTCPMCRKDISFELNEDVREVHVQCNQCATVDDYIIFHELLDKYRGMVIKDIQYLRKQEWVKWVMEHRAKKQSCTKYIFYGLQGNEKSVLRKTTRNIEDKCFHKSVYVLKLNYLKRKVKKNV